MFIMVLKTVAFVFMVGVAMALAAASACEATRLSINEREGFLENR